MSDTNYCKRRVESLRSPRRIQFLYMLNTPFYTTSWMIKILSSQQGIEFPFFQMYSKQIFCSLQLLIIIHIIEIILADWRRLEKCRKVEINSKGKIQFIVPSLNTITATILFCTHLPLAPTLEVDLPCFKSQLGHLVAVIWTSYLVSLVPWFPHLQDGDNEQFGCIGLL